MSATNNKFTTTVCTSTSAVRKYRSDVGPIETQFDDIQTLNKDLKKSNARLAISEMTMTKEAHSQMLLMLISEADHFHATSTKKHICKINRVSCEGSDDVEDEFPSGLSLATLKALVTDVDIVMNDDDKDNYQHALGAVAALSLWH